MLRTGGGIGCGGLILVLVIAWLTGTDPLRLLQEVTGGGGGTPQVSLPGVEPAGGGPPGPGVPGGSPPDELGKFASVVLADLEDTWGAIFRESGSSYAPPKLVLFDRQIPSACGFGSSATGPFYCPADRKVYVDLSFFDELDRRFGAPGDFAAAYVLAHEVGHHVQNALGTDAEVRQAQRRARSEADANRLSVLLELQADCYAGVWAHRAHRDRQLLEPGDVEEGLRAASAIGDDRLQRLGGGEVQPESWTHGSSAERSGWLRRGLDTGDPNACDTFGAR